MRIFHRGTHDKDKYFIFMSVFVALVDTYEYISGHILMENTAIKLGAKISMVNVKEEKVCHV
jgi:hypothetical protein